MNVSRKIFYVGLLSAMMWGASPIVAASGFSVADETATPAASSSVINLPEAGPNGEEIIPLSSLDLSNVTVGWGTLKANRSIDGKRLTLKGNRYSSGVGVHANSRMVVKLNGSVTKFYAICGIDDEVNQNGDVTWRVTLLGEGGSSEVVAEGNALRTDDEATELDIDLAGWKFLVLDVDKNGVDSYDHFDWANAYFEYVEQNSTPPVTVPVSTIDAGLDCATLYFAQPGVKMMQFIRPMSEGSTVTVEGLPEGLTYDTRRSAVTGIVDKEGEYTYKVTVENTAGHSNVTDVKLVVSSNLQMPTPMMGWLSWNVVEGNISQKVVEQVADAMVSTGLADAGYNNLIIDDLWHADSRDAAGNPVEDKTKFPKGMKAAADYAHSKGLRFGIYSDGGTKTCAGRFGSFGYETEDANRYAEWDVDVLKYDYCNAPADQATCIERYKAISDALKASGRDITLYVCEWGVREPWKWGAEIGAPTWRCTYDTRDCWEGKSGGIGILQSIAGMKDLWPYSGPNRFNDADMMCVGINGTGKSSSALCVKVGMTKEEYRTQMSLWCMWASPLTLSFDLTKSISDEDMAIMSNPELIAINQDRMGLQAKYLGEKDGCALFAKDLENGDVAVAVVNLNNRSTNYTIDFSDIDALEPGRKYHFRDCWAAEDLGVMENSFSVNIPVHATKVYRLTDAGVTGISSVDVNKSEMTVNTSGNQVTVNVSNSDNAVKRVIVSDMVGRVLAVGSTRSDSITLDVNAQEGTILMVNTVCNGRAMTAKTELK